MTFTEKTYRWQIANRWAEYRRCRNAPICRRFVRHELRREITRLRDYLRLQGCHTHRAPDWGYVLETPA